MIRTFDDAAPEAGEREAVPSRIVFHFERAFTIDEVAKKLGISPRQVQAHIDDRNLIAVNVGRGTERRDLRVLDEDLEGFMRRRRTGAVPPEKRIVKTDRHSTNSMAITGETFAERRAARLAGRK